MKRKMQLSIYRWRDETVMTLKHFSSQCSVVSVDTPLGIVMPVINPHSNWHWAREPDWVSSWTNMNSNERPQLMTERFPRALSFLDWVLPEIKYIIASYHTSHFTSPLANIYDKILVELIHHHWYVDVCRAGYLPIFLLCTCHLDYPNRDLIFL